MKQGWPEPISIVLQTEILRYRHYLEGWSVAFFLGIFAAALYGASQPFTRHIKDPGPAQRSTAIASAPQTTGRIIAALMGAPPSRARATK